MKNNEKVVGGRSFHFSCMRHFFTGKKNTITDNVLTVNFSPFVMEIKKQRLFGEHAFVLNVLVYVQLYFPLEKAPSIL